ncbi:methionyl-tRNA formyltransferase [Haloferax larsenii]|uniref:Methionyl-tRNA formyltransferase n=1 Tax=Haloferax larsenii TaxID=302484 RepID=A0ABY5RBM5_HALLR|nr:methionyl-tRNA formyltransferase [Haloferax larsenii]UVE49756.1 methionyl-tRNA formyltransferase [Haloferax larsenii]
MRAVFVTHNDIGRTCLEELIQCGADVPAVYTQPKKKSLSDQISLDSFCAKHDIELHRTGSVNDPKTREQIESYDPEYLFVIGWSRLVNEDVLNIPSVTALGMHPAPLPRGRGRAPIAWSLIKGLDTTAMSFFHLVEEADAGDLVAQHEIPIEVEDDAASLYEKVRVAARDLIRATYDDLKSHDVPRIEQDDSKATWWPKRVPRHGLVDWTKTPEELYDWIRGQSHPYPGAFSYLDGTKVRLWSARPPSDDTVFAAPGEILGVTGNGVEIAAWEGSIVVDRIQVGDDEETTGAALLDSYEFEVGQRFENARDVLVD